MNENIEEQELLLRISAASRILSVSRSKLYELVAKNQVPHVKIGNSLRIPVQAMRTSIEKNTEGTI